MKKINNYDESGVKALVEDLLNVDLKSVDNTDGIKTQMENFGIGIQEEAFKDSQVLRSPIQDISKKSEDGEQVANALLDLKNQIDILDPSKVNFNKKKGILGKIFNPTKKYFEKYQKTDAVIGSIMTTLSDGKNMLFNDNVFLKESSKGLQETILKLEKAISFGEALDKELSDKILDCDSVEQKKFLEQDVLFTVRQRLMDLGQQLLLNQQGVASTEIIIANNKELIKGVDRAERVTVVALRQAIVLSNALADQKLILDQVNALNRTTEDMLLSTSKMIGNNGAEINRQATSTMLDAEKFKESFKNINKAMIEMEDFRAKALPQMRKALDEYDRLSLEGGKSIDRLSKKNTIDVSFVGDEVE